MSDEKSCEQLNIDKDYRKTIAPYGSKLVKTDITIDELKVHGITNIDVMANTFDAEVTIRLRWRDHRLTFNDLKADWNHLNAKTQIWLPPLYLSNTKGNVPISTADVFDLQIKRQGVAVRNDVSQLNERNMYSGDENDLYLKVKIESSFICSFELSTFPFDT